MAANNLALRRAWVAAALVTGLAATAAAQAVVTPTFAGSYSLTDLGGVPGVPTSYGGLDFVDADTIIIGGAANTDAGRLYTIDVVRGPGGHITGFTGSAVVYGSVGNYNDGGVQFGPGGVLFTAQWNVNRLGQTKPGSTDEDTVTNLGPLGVGGSSISGLRFLPAGFPGAGLLKVVSYSGGNWYTLPYAPDGTGTYTFSNATLEVTIPGGPEGIAVVPTGSVLFTNPSLLVSEYGAGKIAAYEVDSTGDPVVATRREFVTGLTGAEGAVIDPVTGDFLFSTFGGSNRVVRVSGFAAPTLYSVSGTIRDPGATPLAGIPVALTGTSTASTTTAADGTYSFANLASGGNFTVTPLIAGRVFTPLSRTFNNLSANQTGDFVGTLVYQISGQVRDLNDTGVAGVTITLTGTQAGSVLTDLNGNYVLPNLPIGGTYTVTPTRGSFQFNPASQAFTNLQQDEVAGFFIAQVGSFTRYFAEGATSAFFNTEIALLNATGTPTTATVRFQRPGGVAEVTQTVPLTGIQRVTVDPKTLGLAQAEFSTVIESDQPVIADRTMTWDANAYGSHAETSIGRPLTRWYLAEGATINGFDLFYLIQNPSNQTAEISVQYLLPAPLSPITKTYAVDPLSRFNIWVNQEGGPLGAAEVSAVITSTNNVPVIVERAMYRPVGAQIFGAGHESAGVEAPAARWYFAEGATGPYFDLFFLVANPNAQPSDIEARYLKPDGSVVTRTYTVDPNSRFNVWVDFEGVELADTAVATTFRVTNGINVVIERSMWWWGDIAGWYEGHNSAGATTTGEKWGLAAGEVGGSTALETYILIANTSNTAGTARVTLTFEDGTQAQKDFTLPANSRSNVDVTGDFPAAANKRFGAIVESLGTTPAQIVVERAMYNSAGGVFWAAGTSALGTKLR